MRLPKVTLSSIALFYPFESFRVSMLLLVFIMFGFDHSKGSLDCLKTCKLFLRLNFENNSSFKNPFKYTERKEVRLLLLHHHLNFPIHKSRACPNSYGFALTSPTK